LPSLVQDRPCGPPHHLHVQHLLSRDPLPLGNLLRPRQRHPTRRRGGWQGGRSAWAGGRLSWVRVPSAAPGLFLPPRPAHRHQGPDDGVGQREGGQTKRGTLLPRRSSRFVYLHDSPDDILLGDLADSPRIANLGAVVTEDEVVALFDVPRAAGTNHGIPFVWLV
jgi:hypothetical protein